MALRTLLVVALITIIWLNSSAGRVVSRKLKLKQQIKELEKDLNKAKASILNIQVTFIFYIDIFTKCLKYSHYQS